LLKVSLENFGSEIGSKALSEFCIIISISLLQ
jgi:hypothetical protein